MWMFETNGIYTVKSGYQAIKRWQSQQNTSPTCSSSTQHIWKKIWSLQTIPRHKMILWRILNNTLPVRSELSKKGQHCSILCPRCNSKIETITHTFMTCPNIAKVWFGSNLNINFTNHPNPDFTEWLFNSIQQTDEQTIIQIAALIYSIWFSRNQIVFEDKILPEENIINRARNSIKDYCNAITPVSAAPTHTTHIQQHLKAPSHRTAINNSRWIRPEADFVKANSDASMKVKGVWGLGGIIRNEEGLVMVAATWRTQGYDDILWAEACALMNMLKLAQECEIGRAHV